MNKQAERLMDIRNGIPLYNLKFFLEWLETYEGGRFVISSIMQGGIVHVKFFLEGYSGKLPEDGGQDEDK